MAGTILFDNGAHLNHSCLRICSAGGAVQANQHLIVSGREAILLDPGGHKVYTQLIAATRRSAAPATLTPPLLLAPGPGHRGRRQRLAHDDRRRGLPLGALDPLPAALRRGRPGGEAALRAIPDRGMNGSRVGGHPSSSSSRHFLHSPGNFQVYDPVATILYTGDLGASLGPDYREVPDFDGHVQYMAGFHRRYMASPSALRGWAGMARSLDIEIIAPQHGAVFVGREKVKRFIDWAGQPPMRHRRDGASVQTASRSAGKMKVCP